MFSPGDDQDDSLFDQLRSIRPFTVDQLYLIHPDVGCPPKAAISEESTDDPKSVIPQPHQELYRHLVEYEQLRNQLVKLRHDVKKLYKKTHDHVEKSWSLKEESVKKVAMCQQGKTAETTFKFNKAFIDKKRLSMFSQEFTELTDLITRDYVYYSFESQVKKNKILTQLSISYQFPDQEERKMRLKSAIVTLFEFLRYLSDSKPDFVILCRKWLRALCKKYLDSATTQDYRFIISQLAKSPVGTADWSADLVECKPFEQVSGFESVPQYITHCSAILSELFYSLQLRVKQLMATAAATTGETDNDLNQTSDCEQQGTSSDQNWSLVDPRFNCAEELNIASSNYNLLSESDVIKFCLRIPIAQIFRSHVKKCLEITEAHMETDKNYEYVMLKLLTIGTVIIRTYQIGLETFNSIQYGSLIEYLSSQIRRTVVILSDQWSEFKQRLRGIDDALLMRLQVEYDNFMLRSILIILELRQSGIWRHLSRVEQDADLPAFDNPLSWSTDSLRPAFAKLLKVTGITSQQLTNYETVDKASELVDTSKKSTKMLRKHPSSLTYEFSTEWFKDVSEPMLWHILWQFYHSAFVSSCDYHSDYYWLKKFQEKSVIFLFINKVKDSPPGECSYLINSITSMLLSRAKPESKLVNFIATEIFNLTFKNKSLKDKVSRKGVMSLIRCAEKFPNLISLYLSSMDDDIDENATDLIKSCSLSGWICTESEFNLLESWLIEKPLSSPKNKIARLVICRLLLNSPHVREEDVTSGVSSPNNQSILSAKVRESKRPCRQNDCFVDLKMRRKLALVLYHSSTVHLPENNQFGPQSLGASVEVAFGASLFGCTTEVDQDNLLELAIDPNYQQFYIWVWRILFALRLHILHQSETDWNDIQIRSGTSRSVKNTVLANDPFYPVPSIVDSECSLLADGIKNQNPVAAFIYLLLTDVTWHSDTVDSCLTNLNILADSGHITPSLMAMKFFTICHLNDLTSHLIDDKRFVEYFKKVIVSNFDATRLASLIMTQLEHLKQYRQLQLSHFYIKVFLDVAQVVSKQTSSSWFSSNEISLDKVACVLDFIVRFNFTNQRVELIRKFYDCAYVIQEHQSQPNGWLSSFLTSNSPQRESLTSLHVLARKFKKYAWLQWVTTECDALRLEKVWEDIVAYLSTNDEANLDMAIKKVCPQVNSNLIRSSMPIYSWIGQIFDIMESDLSHPLCPLIWYNFYLNYFANSLNGVSVGVKLVSQETLSRLMTRLDSLYNYHLFKQRNWSSSSAMQQDSLTQLYRAYKLWLQDPSLRDAYVDIDRLKDEYLVPLLKAVMESSNASACLRYVDLNSIETQNRNLIQVWTASTRSSLNERHLLSDPIIYLDNNDLDESQCDGSLAADDELADDAASLIARSLKVPLDTKASRPLDDGHDELSKALHEDCFGERKYRTSNELLDGVKEQFGVVFEESNLFQLNISELNRTKTEIIELVSGLYINKKRVFIRVTPCIEGNECAGPARIKLEAEEALLDERKSQCIQDRRRQCQELVGELLLMPKNGSVQATMMIEENLKRLIDDSLHSKMVIETIMTWLSESENYSQLNGSFYTANHLLKTVLEILSTSDQVDTYNYSLIEVCLAHPESVQILSPYLSPSSCSTQCFLDIYKIVCSKQMSLSPMTTFVLLSKFDIRSWLTTTSRESKKSYHELIVTTCSAFSDIGKNPDKSYELIMDLFKRHLQVELAPSIRQKPDELFLVLEQFSNIMDKQALAPNLWLEFLSIIGLDIHQKQGDCFKMENITESVARLAEGQAVFDHQSLCILVQSISKYLKHRYESNEITLMELYRDYVEQYGLVILSAVFMWVKSTSDAMLTDSYNLIWEQFIGIWAGWIFPTKSSQFNSSYGLMMDFFIVSLQYMFHKIPESITSVLGFLLADMASYVGNLNENLNLELSIMQRCMKSLPWSNLLMSPSEIDHLTTMTECSRHNISDMISHIMSSVDVRKSLAYLEQESGCSLPIMAQTVERLSYIIISQCHHLKGFRLPDKHLALIRTDSIPRISAAILFRADYVNLECSHSNRLLFRLIESTCFVKDTSFTKEVPHHLDHGQYASKHLSATLQPDRIDRVLLYAKFVSNYLVNLLKQNPAILQITNATPLVVIIDTSLVNLEQFVHAEDLRADQKKLLYAALMDCLNCDALDLSLRLPLAKLFVNSDALKSKPLVLADMLQSIGQSLDSSGILVVMVESLVDLYFDTTANYEGIRRGFRISATLTDHYLSSCIKEKTPMALMIYYESQLNESENHEESNLEPMSHLNNLLTGTESSQKARLWPCYLSWLSKLIETFGARTSGASLSSVNACKIATILVRLLVMLELDFKHIIRNDCQSVNDDANSSQSSQSHPIQVGKAESSDGDKTSQAEQGTDRTNHSSIVASPKQKSDAKTLMANLEDGPKCLLGFMQQLITFYDTINPAGLWSYLKSSSKNEHSFKIGITSLTVACFLADRSLLLMKNSSKTPPEVPRHLEIQRDELVKIRRVALSKLEAARRSKSTIDCSQFIDSFVGGVQQNSKVQYGEVVQLISTFVLAR